MKLAHSAYVAITCLVVSSQSLADPPVRAAHEPRAQQSPEYGALVERWSRAHTAATAAELGHVELRLGMATEAAEHLSYALAHIDDRDPAWVDVVYDLTIARKSVVALRVRASEDGAALYVDDRYIGDSPLPHDVFVDEGAHEVRAVLSGFDVARLNLHGARGASLGVELPMTAARAPWIEPRSVVVAGDAGATLFPGKRTWIVVTGSAVALGTLGTGTAFAVATMTGHGNQDATNRDAGVLLVAGGLLLGATLTYTLWPAPASRPEEPPRLQIGLAPVSGGSALRLTGTLDR
jgi:hypothetical protein